MRCLFLISQRAPDRCQVFVIRTKSVLMARTSMCALPLNTKVFTEVSALTEPWIRWVPYMEPQWDVPFWVRPSQAAWGSHVSFSLPSQTAQAVKRVWLPMFFSPTVQASSFSEMVDVVPLSQAATFQMSLCFSVTVSIKRCATVHCKLFKRFSSHSTGFLFGNLDSLAAKVHGQWQWWRPFQSRCGKCRFHGMVASKTLWTFGLSVSSAGTQGVNSFTTRCWSPVP